MTARGNEGSRGPDGDQMQQLDQMLGLDTAWDQLAPQTIRTLSARSKDHSAAGSRNPLELKHESAGLQAINEASPVVSDRVVASDGRNGLSHGAVSLRNLLR